MKVGRNALCWCGSGKKFKKCHMNRSDEDPVEFSEIQAAFRKVFAKQCSVPRSFGTPCSGKIVEAHTVPRGGTLSRIARDGHVYAFDSNIGSLYKAGGVPSPKLIGIGKASTFTGFCSHHDKSVFAPVEDQPFNGTPEQCFLLGYRAVSRETYLKNAQVTSLDFARTLDRGRSFEDQMGIQMMQDSIAKGTDLGQRDSSLHKSKYDKVLESGDFSSVRAYVLTFAQPPSIVCNGEWSPEFDFNGNLLQDLEDSEMIANSITFNSLATASGGAVVFTWLPDSDTACERFILSLQRIPDTEVANALVRFFFEFCENIYMSPTWWEGLSEEKQNRLVQRFRKSVSFAIRSADCLCDDATDYDQWTVTSRVVVP